MTPSQASVPFDDGPLEPVSRHSPRPERTRVAVPASIGREAREATILERIRAGALTPDVDNL